MPYYVIYIGSGQIIVEYITQSGHAFFHLIYRWGSCFSTVDGC